MSNQRGFAHLILLILLLVGVGVGVYLATQTQIFRSKASSGETIQIVDSAGNSITKTQSPTVNVKLIEPISTSVTQSQTSTAQSPVSVSVLKAALNDANPKDGNHVAWASKGVQTETFKLNKTYRISFDYRSYVTWELRIRDNGLQAFNPTKSKSFERVSITRTLTDDLDQGYPCKNYGQGDYCYLLIHMYGSGILEIANLLVEEIEGDTPKKILYSSANWDGWETCISDWRGDCGVSVSTIENGEINLPGNPTNATPPPLTEQNWMAILSEDPNFSYSISIPSSKYKTGPITYTFSSLTPGLKTLYAKFVDPLGKQINSNPFPATVELVPPSDGVPTGQPVTNVNTDTSYDMGVLVLKYFPLDSGGKNIDIKVTGDVGEEYSVIRKRTIDSTSAFISALEKATSYLGYKDAAAKPALRYNIVDTKEYIKAVPIKPKGPRVSYPDYNGIMQDHNICDYVDNKGVREVWIWAYQGPNRPEAGGTPYLGIDESKMSSLHGDISNSYGYNDMPICKYTYRVYTFNYNSKTENAMHSWGHQLESELAHVDPQLFQELFQGPRYPGCDSVNPPDITGDGKVDNADRKECILNKGDGIGRCGSVHNPPNSTREYDTQNSKANKSDCMDWNPDTKGVLSDVSCEVWGCSVTDEYTGTPTLKYYIWLWQNLPGRNNTKTYQGRILRNWWDIHGDFDNVILSNKYLAAPLFISAASQNGLKGEYFNNKDLSGLPVLTRYDNQVIFDWNTNPPHPTIPKDFFSVRWSGRIMPKYTEEYTIYATGDDAVRVYINGAKILDNWSSPTAGEVKGTVNLTANTKADIIFEYFQGILGANAKLEWSSPSQVREIIPSSQLFNQ